MKYIRRSEERGYVEAGWLKSFHTFSFGEYYDPRFMGYKDLRVINHDFIEKNSGFPLHGHKDMEIITYVLSGAVEHQDSLGNKAQTVAGDVQVMHAGRGIRHSEYNPSKSDELELLQIWIMPKEGGLEPGYVQQAFPRESKINQLKLIAAPNPEEDGAALQIHANAKLYAAVLEEQKQIEVPIAEGHGVWLQVARGEIKAQGETLKKGDAIVVEKEERLKITGLAADSEILIFDLWG